MPLAVSGIDAAVALAARDNNNSSTDSCSPMVSMPATPNESDMCSGGPQSAQLEQVCGEQREKQGRLNKRIVTGEGISVYGWCSRRLGVTRRPQP